MDKEDKVLEGCVEVCLLLQSDDVIKVGVVDMGVNSKQSLQYRLSNGDEVTRK